MTQRDRGIVAALGIALIVLSLAVALPRGSIGSGVPGGSGDAAGSPSAGPSTPDTAVYREGTIGRPSSINPLTARTQADRDLVALVFSGLVGLGPDGTYRPDLAAGWTVDAKGKTWTFTIRPDARWQDGEPVTSDDVVFTVNVLKSPGYTGPMAASWREVSVTAVDARTVRFELTTPIGGFLQAATIGLLPAHLLSETPIETLADDPFSVQPVGAGPFVLTSWNAESATLIPASAADVPATDPVAPSAPSDGPAPAASGSPVAPGSSGAAAAPAAPSSPAAASPPTAAPTPVPTDRPEAALPGIALHFYQDAASLAAAYRAGNLDAAAGLPADIAGQLAAVPGNHLLSYPRTTLTAIALNLRPGNGELRLPVVRHGLLAAIDRTKLIATVFGGAATRADSAIPPSSWAFDPSVSRPVRFDLKRAAADFKAGGWKRRTGGWAAPGGKKPYVLELIAPNAESNPTAMAVAQAVAADWTAFGLRTVVTGLTPAQFVQERLRKGKFQSAAIDVNIGLDPDLYPLFASTQATSAGSNISGIQDVLLDRDLIRARAPGSDTARKAAYSKLQQRLVDRTYILPIAFRTELVVVSDRLSGPVVRELGDPADRYWDVLTWLLADGG
ncbi:MAG: peptide/nickel transport system substrate-binding protein [Chloroflexota bacterium]|nr:peptide/nickel transport system substrate-binding protein [Chloroflexota bacterium]